MTFHDAMLAPAKPKRPQDPTIAERLAEPDLSPLGPHLTAPFQAWRLRQARVVWRNQGWLLARGVDPGDAATRQAFDHWLLDRFALSTRYPQDPESVFMDAPPVQLGADRYGGPSGSTHGGSGRCALRDGYLIKGVGRTPLVAPSADYWHGNGFLPLSEAIHEAIGAEICQAEGPNGAVPIVAIIATGARCHGPDGAPGEERALSVRPAFVRLAHLQRSIFFGDAGWSGAAQTLDARRTGDALRAVWGSPERRADVPVEATSAADTLRRWAVQFAFSRAHRLWPSTFSSSNFTLDGASLDHGSFKATQDWTSAEETPGLPRFGAEAHSIASQARSLAFLGRKHLAAEWDHNQLARDALVRLSEAFQEEIRLALGLPQQTPAPIKDALYAPFARLWSAQQRVQSFLGDPGRRDWLHVYLRDPDLAPRNASRPESWQAARDLRETLAMLVARRALTPAQALAVEAAALRFSRPRPELYHHHLRGQARRLSRRVSLPVADPHAIETFIDDKLSVGRRLWRRLPAFFRIEAQACSPAWSVLAGREGQHGRPAIWLEATVCDGRAHIFNQTVDLDAFAQVTTIHGRPVAFGLFEVDAPWPASMTLPRDQTLRLPTLRTPYPLLRLGRLTRGEDQ